jgi:hypothetical protein
MKAHSSDLTQLHAFSSFSPSVTRFSSASNDSDSGNRGKTFNVYRTGRLCRTRQFEIRSTIQAYKIETTTYKAIPVSTDDSVSSDTFLLLSSRGPSTLKAQSTMAILMNSESLATCLPMQVRRPKPYELAACHASPQDPGSTCHARPEIFPD